MKVKKQRMGLRRGRSFWGTKVARREAVIGIIFLLPSFIGVSIFLLLPFTDAVRRSFSETMTRTFVGWENYNTIFHNSAFVLASKNTLKFMGICLPLLIVISMILSVMLYSIRWLQSFIKTTYLVPLVIPAASIVMLWKLFFQENGLINRLLDTIGLATHEWMNTDLEFVVLVFTYIWKNVGYDMVLWLAGLNSINQEMYEAAAIDGAGSIRKFFFITLPNLRSTMFIVIVLSMINSFKVFREAYLIAGDYPHSIYMLQHLFNNWFMSLDVQKICAAAVLVAIIMIVAIGSLKLLLDRDTAEESV